MIKKGVKNGGEYMFTPMQRAAPAASRQPPWTEFAETDRRKILTIFVAFLLLLFLYSLVLLPSLFLILRSHPRTYAYVHSHKGYRGGIQIPRGDYSCNWRKVLSRLVCRFNTNPPGIYIFFNFLIIFFFTTSFISFIYIFSF